VSAAYFLVFDKKPAGFDPFVNGKALADAGDELVAIARRAGVTPLSEFISYSEREKDAFGLSDQQFAMLPRDRWFTPGEISRTVITLVHALKTDPGAVPSAEKVLRDLAEYETVLSEASRLELKCHVAIDY
jgi:hypothetical protein